jgi:hypothetical protein
MRMYYTQIEVADRLRPQTTRRLEMLLPPVTREEARRLLTDECGSNLPLSGDINPASLERVHFAARKVSDGQIEKLKKAIELAKADWRDLLVDAGFAHDPEAHRSWLV